MDGDPNDVKILIEQRSQRPVYARVISWEFCRDHQHEEEESRKSPKKAQKKNTRSISMKGNQEQKQKEQYLNEEEDDDYMSDSSMESFVDDLNTSGESDYFTGHESSIEGVTTTGFKCNPTLAQPFRKKHSSGHKKRRKQKREKAREACWKHLNAITLGVEEPIIELDDNVHDDRVLKSVPSLVELCMNVDWVVLGTLRGRVTKAELPPLIRQLVSYKQCTSQINATHLSWLQNMTAIYEGRTYFSYKFIELEMEYTPEIIKEFTKLKENKEFTPDNIWMFHRSLLKWDIINRDIDTKPFIGTAILLDTHLTLETDYMDYKRLLSCKCETCK